MNNFVHHSYDGMIPWLIVDPLKKFEHVSPMRIVDALGILPTWLTLGDERPVLEQFNSNYQFGLHPISEGELSDDGIFSYPGDPPLYPLGKQILNGEKIYYYQHALVAIQQPDNSFVYIRMD